MFESRGPCFKVDHEVFADSCPMGQGDYNGCNPILSMSFVRGWEDAPTVGMNPAALICHGLRKLTEDEAKNLAKHGQPVPGQVCDLEVRYVPETGESLG